jgi:hypothetical protein
VKGMTSIDRICLRLRQGLLIPQTRQARRQRADCLRANDPLGACLPGGVGLESARHLSPFRSGANGCWADSLLRGFKAVILTLYVRANSEESVSKLYRATRWSAKEICHDRSQKSVVSSEVAAISRHVYRRDG